MTNLVEISDLPEFRDADPNGLAIAYMAVLETSSVARVIITGAPYAKAVTETNTFLSSAEGELVDFASDPRGDDDPRGEQNRSPSPSPHGRTRMIVFPLRRSVELKAATASSRVETLP